MVVALIYRDLETSLIVTLLNGFAMRPWDNPFNKSLVKLTTKLKNPA